MQSCRVEFVFVAKQIKKLNGILSKRNVPPLDIALGSIEKHLMTILIKQTTNFSFIFIVNLTYAQEVSQNLHSK